MVDQDIQRKLAVLLHADVVDSTNLVRRSETLAHQRIRDVFLRFSETITSHAGTAHEIRGDALVAEFNKASDAVSAAVIFQDSNDDFNNSLAGDIRPKIRIGIAMGEVVVADRTITGEGIVLAQRLEQLAKPGGICIHDAVYQTLPKWIPFVCKNLGEHHLKGFDDPVKIYAVSNRKLDASSGGGELSDDEVGGSKVNHPSIAVLPFNNMSSDPEQVYFADGIAEDIITALSRFHDLLVIARNSSFTYRGSSIDVRKVGRELNVQYVLEGSVRLVGDRVRINAQLIETLTGNHVWAERFDRPVEDIFELQDEITALVASIVGQQVRVTEVKGAFKRGQQDLGARDIIARAQWHMDQVTETDFAKARDYAEIAIRRYPNYIRAYSMFAFVSIMELIYGWGNRSVTELISDATENALAAIRIDPDDEFARAYLAEVFWMTGRHDEAIKECETVLRHNSNFSAAIGIMGIAHAHSGPDSYQPAVECLEMAIRLSPNDPWLQFYYANRGTAEFWLENYDEAISWYQKSIQRNPDLSSTLRMLISAYALKGDIEKARQLKRRLLKLKPNYSIEDVSQRVKFAFRNTEDFEHTLRGLRLAGIPEN